MVLLKGGEDMKEIYVPPKTEIITFKMTDVIMTSNLITLNNVTDPNDIVLDDYETLPAK